MKHWKVYGQTRHPYSRWANTQTDFDGDRDGDGDGDGDGDRNRVGDGAAAVIAYSGEDAHLVVEK